MVKAMWSYLDCDFVIVSQAGDVLVCPVSLPNLVKGLDLSVVDGNLGSGASAYLNSFETTNINIVLVFP